MATPAGVPVGDVRLRQVVVAAHNGSEVIDQLGTAFGLFCGYRDPAVAAFGLENHVFALGNQFLELVSPVTDTAPVWKFLHKIGRQAAGYMIVLQVGAVAPYRVRAEALDLPVVLDSDSETWSTLHLHPRAMGSLLSVDHDKRGDWVPAGPDWQERSGASALAGIARVRIATADPTAMASRWAAFLDLPSSAGATLQLSQGIIEFVPSTSRSDGLVGISLAMSGGARVGERSTIAGTEFRIVT
jgi:hypothetical protein